MGSAAPGEELRALVATCTGVGIASACKLSTLAAPRHKACAYRIELADGRVLKGRWLRDALAGERLAWVLERVPHPAFPRLLARCGRALLMEWIDGRPLPAGRVPGTWLRAAAEFLARLHGTPLPVPCPFATADPLALQAEREQRYLARLLGAGSVNAATGARLAEQLCALRPARVVLGFVHGDLCGENLVVDASDRLRVIDNEAVGVDACDGDLARSLYRWSLDARDRDVFLGAYARHRSIETFLAQQGYWSLLVRLASAAHRVGAAPDVARLPLRGLASLLDPSLEPVLEGDALGAH